MALLELTDVEARYGAVPALFGVSLHVDEGEAVALLGANGAGKTTTLRAISNTVRRSGEIAFAGRPLRRLAPEAIARLGIAHVPEGRGLVTELTVWENLLLGGASRSGGRAVRQDSEEMLRRFPAIASRRRQQAGTLSGGEQQMLALARALVARPRLLLLDEPSLGLAPLAVKAFYEIVSALNREEGLSVLVVEQNTGVALDVTARAYVLEVGAVKLQGASDELSRDESVRLSYLGN